MKTMVKAKKIGGSIMVTIPKEIVEKKSIKELAKDSTSDCNRAEGGISPRIV